VSGTALAAGECGRKPKYEEPAASAARLTEELVHQRRNVSRKFSNHIEKEIIMSIAQSLLPEFDQEMAGLRKTLERIPDDKLDWKAHPKSNTIRWVGSHLADLPSWAVFTLKQSALDIAPVGGPAYTTAKLNGHQEMVAALDKNVAAAREAIATMSDAAFMEPWSLLSGGKTIFTMPRIAVIRNFVMNHIIHHRAVLCVYLRLNDIPVPSLYGPSGDE
jgi:uncharacterized damage-inducible protein DinB